MSRLLGWIPVLVLLAALGVGWLADARRARDVRMSVQVTPSQLPADGKSRARVLVRILDRTGRPRVGDAIEVVTQGAGALDRFRALTDRHGEAAFEFTSARGNVYRPAGPVTFLVTNTSLGKVVEVTKSARAVLKTYSPSAAVDGRAP